MKFFKTLSYLIIIVSLFSCNKDDDVTIRPSTSISELVSTQNDLSIFMEALNIVSTQDVDISGVVNGGFTSDYMIFAPNNTAFESYFTANGFGSINDIPLSTLVDLINYHIYFNDVLIENEFETGYLYASLKVQIYEGDANFSQGSFSGFDNLLSLYINTSSGIILNGISNIIESDLTLTTSLGNTNILHKIDNVLTLPTLNTFINADSDLSTFNSLLSDTEIDNTAANITSNSVAGFNPFTTFAPLNSAFNSAFETLGVTNLSELKADIGITETSNLLNYHILPNIVMEDLDFASIPGQSVNLTQLNNTNVISKIQDSQKVLEDETGNIAQINANKGYEIFAVNGSLYKIGGVLLLE